MNNLTESNKETRKDFSGIITDDEWNEAVEYLRRNISKDTIDKLKKKVGIKEENIG